MNIRIYVTGGTFDKEYNELNGELFFKDTHVPEMLKLGRCKLRIDFQTLLLIDSLDMTPADRAMIADQCKNAKENRIIITHGTDTICETAEVIGQAKLPKTIVLTGAMIPYTFRSSDGFFNLGSALAFVQTLPPGVYIAMNGKYFTWDNVKKDKQAGEFVEL